MKAGRTWTRDRIRRHLVQRFYVRFHMTLILASAGLVAMLGNWLLLRGFEVHSMWIRYPVAVALSYLAFLCGVWLWLRYVGVGRRESADASFDGSGLDIPSGGGGGSGRSLPEVFDGHGGGSGGAGATGSWGEPAPLRAMAADGGSGSGGSSFSLGDIGDLDAEGIVLLLLALVLIAAVFLASGYVIWFAPDILTEAVFGATLAAGLSRTARRNDSAGWVAGVVRKTWWPFAIVLVIAEAFAIFAAINFPAAATLGQALILALE